MNLALIMLTPSSNHQRIAFDRFEADLLSGELLKSGHRIRLQAKPFQLLVLLLEHPGEVVTREEVCRKLWNTDTFVDFDHSLGTAINKIREALGDSAEHPRFVETLPRRGYRFIGEVTAPAQLPVPAETPNPKLHWSSRPLLGAGIAASLFLLLAVFVLYRRFYSREVPPTNVAVPFTAFPGIEEAPSFSPDGSRIAFAWDGDPSSGGKGFDLYVKAIGSETLLRLTHHPSDWISSAWSPDGTQIAFHRIAGPDTGLYLVPALGGPERKLRTTHVPYSNAAPISWSPDGKWLAFSDPSPGEPKDRLHLLSLGTLETRDFPHNPKCLHEAELTYSHRGDQLAYVCVHSTSDFELDTVPLSGTTPKPVYATSNFLMGFSWSGDDKRLIGSRITDTDYELYEVTLASGSSRRLDFAGAALRPAVSPKGDKLAYSSYSAWQANFWRMDLLHPDAPPVQLVASSRPQISARYSPDGRHIVFASARAGSPDIWMSDADGGNLVQLSKLGGNAANPFWSPDGQKIAFDLQRSGNLEIYVVDVSERIPRKLVTNVQKTSWPSWSRDGRWIYFRSYETLGHKIYRCPAAGGDAIALGGEPDGIAPQESLDGNFLYFAVRNVNTRLLLIPLNGSSAESSLEGLPPIHDASFWTLVSDGIYFVPEDSPKSLRYFDFKTKKIHEIAKVQIGFADGLSVSPDGRWLLYPQVEKEGAEIMLVDHFH